MTEDEFFAVLKATVGEYTWRQENRFIRASKADVEMGYGCPVTVVYHKKTGEIMLALQYRLAAAELHLDPEFALDIGVAADNKYLNAHEQPMYRKKLIEILGLHREDIP